MGRTLLAVLLGAVIHFAWSAASWMFIGWHEPTVGPVPSEDAFMSGLGRAATEEKAYFFPPPPGKGASKADEDKYKEKVKGGSSGVVLVTLAPGIEPMSLQQYGNGLLLDLISTVMVVFVLVLTLPAQQNYLKRVFIVIVMAIFAAVTAQITFWNWMSFPLYFTAINAADTVVGWTAAGLVIAALVKPDARAAGAAPAKV